MLFVTFRQNAELHLLACIIRHEKATCTLHSVLANTDALPLVTRAAGTFIQQGARPLGLADVPLSALI